MPRNPKPASMIDKETYKKSNKTLEKRKKAEENMKTTANLRVPSHLTEEAKKKWRQLITLYKEMDADILSDLDKDALAIYCEAYAIYKEAQRAWTHTQRIVSQDPDKQRVLDKIFQTMEKQSRIMAKFSEQLCLTPIGRAKMGVKSVEKSNPLKDMMMDDDDE